jgi:hypothetical protein
VAGRGRPAPTVAQHATARGKGARARTTEDEMTDDEMYQEEVIYAEGLERYLANANAKVVRLTKRVRELEDWLLDMEDQVIDLLYGDDEQHAPLGDEGGGESRETNQAEQARSTRPAPSPDDKP